MCVCVCVGLHTHLVVWSWGTSALVRVTGNERLVGLKSITTATASHNPIPSHPTQELRAAWLARSPWGTEAATQALSAYSLCQLWLRVCVQRASRALKERLAHFGKRRCELCRRTPTVSVSVCAALPVWEEQATLNRYRLFCPGFSDSLNLVMKVCLPTIFFSGVRKLLFLLYLFLEFIYKHYITLNILDSNSLVCALCTCFSS